MTNYLSKYINSEVESMRLNGGLTPTFDGFGNLLISSNETNLSSSVITVELYSPKFSTDSINKVSNTNFSELASTDQSSIESSQVSSGSDVKALYDDQVEINKDLQTKLDDLTLKLNDPEKTSDDLQVKDTIIELRIALGQGSSEEDFSTEFPYINLN